MTRARGLLAGLSLCLARLGARRGDRLGRGSGAPPGHGVRGDGEPGQMPIWYYSISNVGNAPVSAPIVFKQTFPEGVQPAAPE